MRIQVSHILDQVIMSKSTPISAYVSTLSTVVFSSYSSFAAYPIAKDNVNVHIDSVVYWHVIDPFQSTYGISNVQQALVERTKTTLRQVLGAKVLQEIIENREQLGHEIQEIIDLPAHAWGVAVESILIKDIQFSKSLQEALSSAAQAKRIAESKVIQAQSEVDSAKLMRQAAECKSSFFCSQTTLIIISKRRIAQFFVLTNCLAHDYTRSLFAFSRTSFEYPCGNADPLLGVDGINGASQRPKDNLHAHYR